MATILLAWELGSGWGHVLRLLPLAQGLASAKSHHVWAAFRSLTRAAPLYARLGVRFLQAPGKSEGNVYAPQNSHYAHLLANAGFGQDQELFALASAWRNLFRFTHPDLIVFDHSPTALLASRGLVSQAGHPVRRIVVGNGFTTPPDTTPMPAVRSLGGTSFDLGQIDADEERVLKRVNKLLSLWKESPLSRLSQVYRDVDETMLTTLPELDHYKRVRESGPGVEGAKSELSPPYFGPTHGNSSGAKPEWPHGTGPRIFAYLKRSRACANFSNP